MQLTQETIILAICSVYDKHPFFFKLPLYLMLFFTLLKMAGLKPKFDNKRMDKSTEIEEVAAQCYQLAEHVQTMLLHTTQLGS